MHAIAQGDTSTPNKEQFIPKSKRADFTGTIEIIATVRASEDERRAVSDFARSNLQAQVQQDSIPEVFTIRKYFKFENSKFTREGSTWALGLQAKLKGKRTFSNLGSETEEWREIVKFIQGRLPRIIYFPNFLFHFPDKILISGAVENGVEAREKANEYFVRVIQDAMASLRPPLDLHKHIVERVLEKNKGDPFSSFMQVWFGSPDSENVEAVQERLAEQITKEVFGRWKQVLGREIEDTQIEVKNQIEYNETKSEREVYLTFRVKQGSHRYNISERSLGFRWFFCFLLFTRFSGASNAEKSVVFLLDEPASNLHSKAQAKLLDSFEVITGENNALIYSTHSHHLINPLWLETAHVVSSGVDLDADMEGSMTSVSGGISIEVTPYRRFVGQSAEKSHFFQPILDRLEYSPSKLEAVRAGVIVEGKSDYYILNWYKKYHATGVTLDFVPVNGVSNARALLSLYLGWCSAFVFLLDADSEGRDAKERYLNELPLRENQVLDYEEIFGNGKDSPSRIEDLLSSDFKQQIARHFSISRVNKKHIQRAFAEALYGTNPFALDCLTGENLHKVVSALEKRLSSQ